jgi:hypothetical protein
LVNDSPPPGSAESATVWPDPDAAGAEVLVVDDLLEFPHAANSMAAATEAIAVRPGMPGRLVVSMLATLGLDQARR